MRLVTRLTVSHTLPLIVISAALALVLAALGRMTLLVGDLGDDELGTLARESSLHGADWNLDLAMRHAQLQCARGDEAIARDAVRDSATVLRARIPETVPVTPALAEASEGYLRLADTMLARGVCAPGDLQAERNELDARITTIWVDRLAELHTAAREQEERARALGTTALLAGVLLACVALLLSLWTARRLSREISKPLRRISVMASRLSNGDFGQTITATGPVEIVELAEELERMRARLEELETLKQGFLASVSHELRTPLSKIREALSLLSDGAVGKLDDRQARVVAIARNACEREIRLVSTLLDLSRLRAGNPLRRRSGISVDDVIRRAVTDEESEAAGRGVDLELRAAGDTPSSAIDEALLERAVANLIRNAVAVSRRGQRVLVEREVVRAGPMSEVILRVSDEGPGVPDAVKGVLFDPFVTVPVTGSPKAVGTGLGLALSREVARAHGGELELDESRAVGASFVMRLPLADRASRPPPGLHEAVHPNPESGS